MPLLLVLAGWFTWTLAEYVLHRFGMHAAKGRGLASREHLRHHADRDSVLEKWALSWSGVLLAGAGLAWSLHPAFGAGWVLGYGFYDWQHYWAHRRAPRNRYQRFVRRHHFHHHFGHPMRNHGVTTAFWDRVFGTLDRPEVITVPRRMAMPWLVDSDGELRAEYAGDYALAGAATLDDRLASLDRARAFASLAPTPA